MKKNTFLSKKTLLSFASAAVLIAVLGGTVLCSASSSGRTSIGEEAAKAAAYTDAGVEADDVLYVKTEFDYDDGIQIYEIEFTAGGKEYDYEIKAEDGAVIKKQVEILPSARNVSNSADSLTIEDAKEIALTDAGLTADQVYFIKADLGRNNRTAVYDIEFYTAEAEYEYEISTSSGTIYKKSKENRNNYTQSEITPAAPSDAYSQAAVTLEEAKEIAANDAGVSVSEAAFTTAKPNEDDGIIVYDIEFYYGTNKYEYEISSTDGTVIEKSVKNKSSRSSSNNSTNDKEDNKNHNSSSQNQASDSYISLDEAKQIAAEKAGVSLSDVTFKKAKLDRDDGLTVYEIEFYSGRLEYEVTVNAVNGNVIEFEIDD